MPKTDSVSLFLELTELQGALEAARTLVIGLQGVPDQTPEVKDGLVQVGSVATLVIERVRLLRAVVEGQADARLLLARHNKVGECDGADDVLLAPQPRASRVRR